MNIYRNSYRRLPNLHQGMSDIFVIWLIYSCPLEINGCFLKSMFVNHVFLYSVVGGGKHNFGICMVVVCVFGLGGEPLVKH